MKYFKSNFLLILLIILGVSCKESQSDNRNTAQNVEQEEEPIVASILNDEESFYYVNFENYPERDKSLPIGVFDSGTGGLTVLDALVNFDKYNNGNKEQGSDNLPDFTAEKFIYLADQANMPYGNYSSEEKTALLVEHIIKDTQFLLSNKYYREGEQDYQEDKQPVKSIVIACNTATAYGSEFIREFVDQTGIDLKVIGVIDAGARGTLATFEKNENGSIGVMATVGTIASKGYENTLLKVKNELGYTGDIQVFNQGGHGIAEAVDEEPDFINRELDEPREDYRGPSLDNAEFRIDKTLMDVYNFDFDHGKMLCDNKNTDDCQILQINDSENYVRYHLVSLLEKIRTAENPQPLKAIVLGCTHYPYLTSEIDEVLDELYNYQKDGEYIYREFMQEDISIVDPAVNVADELYLYMKEQDLFNPAGDMNNSEFYISVPNTKNPNVKVDEKGRFPYEYKYGRTEGEIQEYVQVVPFSKNNISEETLDRFKSSIPQTYSLIEEFNRSNPKAGYLQTSARIQ
ncbi:glutamate racemase [Salinimicrobium sp. GXAS 041]|uniref:glutamate racemase n=1 Tax=Salinimicrobium sp. GXAS 041 TaxID=3400806 RepID=UPI003C70CC5C